MRAQGCPRVLRECQHRLMNWSLTGRAGYQHGDRLVSLVVSGLSDSLRALRRWSALRAQGLVKWHGSWAWMSLQDEAQVQELPGETLYHLLEDAMA